MGNKYSNYTLMNKKTPSWEGRWRTVPTAGQLREGEALQSLDRDELRVTTR